MVGKKFVAAKTSTPRQIGIPMLLKACVDPAFVLMHLLLQAQRRMGTADLWALQKGAMKWSKARVEHELHKLKARGLVNAVDDQWHVSSTAQVNSQVDPHAVEVAKCLLRDFARQGIVEKVESRRERILHELAASGAPVTAAELFARISSHYPADLRTFQRDLVDLGKQGRASRSDAGWSAATEILDDLFEDRARAAALRLLGQAFEAAVPWEIQKSLREPLARARKKLEALPPGDPRNRWIEAFRLQPGHLELDDPVIDPEVIDAIQDAILQRTKVRVTAQTHGVVAQESFTAVGAVSHYLLEMPGRPSIEFWPDGSNRPARIRLEDIEAIESLAAANAYWPAGHEPTPIPAEVEFVLGDAQQHGALTKIVLRVSPDAALELRKRKIGHKWAEERTDGEGWCIVSFRAQASMPLYRYLRGLRGVVILRPTLFWKFAHMDHRQALRDYEQSLELVRAYQQQECDEQATLPSSNSEDS